MKLNQKYMKLIISSLTIITILMSEVVIFRNEQTLIVKSQESMSVEKEEVEETSQQLPIYDFELMEANGVEPLDVESFGTIEEVIDYVYQESGVDPAFTGIAYYNFIDEDTYYINGSLERNIASIYKVPLAMFYLDGISSGNYTLDTLVPLNGSHYQEGAGDIQINSLPGSYPGHVLLDDMIRYSNNTSAWGLFDFVTGGWVGFANMINSRLPIENQSQRIYEDSYLSPAAVLSFLYEAATDPTYDYLIELMKTTEGSQLFTSYVIDEQANKFGRYEGAITDCAIAYHDDEPLFILVGLTEDVGNGDIFLELLNLRVNEWVRANY